MLTTDTYSAESDYYEPLESIEFEHPSTNWSAQSSAPIAGQLDDDNHLQMEDLYGVQTRYFDIGINASLSDCAKNKNNSTWKMNPELAKFMQQVVATKNRTNADDAERVGDLTRVIPLQATIVEVMNEHDVPIGINIPGFVPNTFTSNGRFLWTIQPRTPPTPVNHVISEPDNFLTRRMYKNLQKCDMARLNREIKFSTDEPDAAQMRTDGLAFDVLIDATMDGHFGNTLNAEAIRDAAKYSRWVEIDADIAQKVYDSIKTPLMDIEERFMNFNDLQANFARADGKPFDSPHGLVGSPINGVSTGFIDTMSTFSPKRVSARVKLDFVTF